MAELGIAASGIAIASIVIQVGDSILKLKSFWDNVKEAPEEIRLLIEEIETLSLVLSGFRSNEAASDLPELELESGCVTRCLEQCRRGADILETVVKEIDGMIGKRKRVGSFKAVLKKGTIERLEKRLRSAQFMLMLSNQAYSEALQKQRHELQRQWAELQQRELGNLKTCFSHSIASVSSPSITRTLQAPPALPEGTWTSSNGSQKAVPSSRSLEQAVERVKKAQTRQRSFIAKLGAPRWLYMSNRVLEVSGVKAPCGWDVSIRTYNIVSVNAPVMAYARRGDVSKVQRMLAEGKASLSDQTEHGYGILDWAARSGQLGLVKFLVGQNARLFKTIHILSWLAAIFGSKQGVMEAFRLLIPCLELEVVSLDQALDELTSWYCGDADILSWMIPQLGFSLQNLSRRERIRYSTNLLSWLRLGFRPDAARLAWLFIENRRFDPATSHTTDQFGFSLLHGVAWNFDSVVDQQLHDQIAAEEYTNNGNNLSEAQAKGQKSSELLYVLRELVSANPTRLHGLAFRSHCVLPGYRFSPAKLLTPLLTVFLGLFHDWPPGPRPNDLEETQALTERAKSVVSIWLLQLKSAGVDLVEYGRKEKETYVQRQVSKEWPLDEFFCIRLISFTYGPEPSDWQFWFTTKMENYFLHFWDMVDNPERTIPGAWIEDDPWPWDDNDIFDPEFEKEVTEADCDVYDPEYVEEEEAT